ncbi:MAG TPA: helix-turn-helix transcriptional regulator [Oscillospiraceae bacterium]|nr:helix-turn-helix transcriptional regulator [Oscillospiraceae bacterium]
MDELKKVVARNILELRTLSKMTQFELGEKLNYSDKAISKWERAESIPDAYVLKQMGDLFGVSVDYLLCENGDKKKEIPAPQHNNHLTITKISIVGVFTFALFVFIVLWAFGHIVPLVLIYAIPVSLVVLLVLNSVWRRGKDNFYIISALVWSLLASFYLSFLHYNWWLIFALGIPAEVIIYLSFKLSRTPKR